MSETTEEPTVSSDTAWRRLRPLFDMYTLPVGLNSFYGQHIQFWNQVLSGAVLLTLPILIIFIIFQKQFIEGMASSGMKE